MYENADPKKALQLYEECLTIDRNHAFYNSSVWVTMAKLHKQMDDDENALLSAENAIAIDPKNFHATLIKGDIYMNLEEWNDAKNQYIESVIIL